MHNLQELIQKITNNNDLARKIINGRLSLAPSYDIFVLEIGIAKNIIGYDDELKNNEELLRPLFLAFGDDKMTEYALFIYMQGIMLEQNIAQLSNLDDNGITILINKLNPGSKTPLRALSIVQSYILTLTVSKLVQRFYNYAKDIWTEPFMRQYSNHAIIREAKSSGLTPIELIQRLDVHTYANLLVSVFNYTLHGPHEIYKQSKIQAEDIIGILRPDLNEEKYNLFKMEVSKLPEPSNICEDQINLIECPCDEMVDYNYGNKSYKVCDKKYYEENDGAYLGPGLILGSFVKLKSNHVMYVVIVLLLIGGVGIYMLLTYKKENESLKNRLERFTGKTLVNTQYSM